MSNRNEDTENNMGSYFRSQLITKFIGQRLYYYPRLISTMDEAKKIARAGTPDGSVVIADKQTSGRGRLNRVWLSPQGSLAMSIILQPSLNSLPQLTMAASLAVVQAIKETTDLEAYIKWPNDVLIRDRKVCGILIESELKEDAVNFTIVGIGININLNPLSHPEISTIATSLSYERGEDVPQSEFTIALLYRLEQLYLKTQAGISIYETWQKRMGTLGEWIQVRVGDSIEQGKAESVTETGNLILRRTNGTLADIAIGDVTVMRF